MTEQTTNLSIHGGTKIYGIVGWPVCHSLSPSFQQYFIKNNDIDAVYVPFPVAQQNQFNSVLQGLRHAGVQGLNITVPYKELAFKHSQPDKDALRIGAVNTLYPSDDGWSSSNTDWLGFKKVIEQRGWQLNGCDVLLFGAGGTARAMVHALFMLGIKKLYISNRTAERAQRLQQHISKHYPSFDTQLVKWDEQQLKPIMFNSKLLINSTSIGLRDADQFPFELCGSGYALDAVYRPSGKTAFKKAATQCGRDALDGLAMLVAQGAASFALWHHVNTDWLDALLWLERKLKRCNALLWENQA